MKTLAVEALRAEHGTKRLLVAASLAQSTFYDHRKRLRKPDPYSQVKDLVREIFAAAQGRYGYRRVRVALASRGVQVSGKKVRALMLELGLYCKVRRRRRYSSFKQSSAPVAENLLAREFSASAPGRKWVTDVTEFRVGDRKLYLSPVMDLFNREIVAHTTSTAPSVAFTRASLTDALAQLPAGGGTDLLVHSDQGLHYRHESWSAELVKVGARQSMSRIGNCYDNAVMENFFGHLKEEAFHHERFETIEELTAAIDEYIAWYNTDRISTALGGVSPITYRCQAASAA